MSNIDWTGTTSGNWTTAADWSGGAVPTSSDNVTIAVAGITVTLSTGVQAASSLVTTLSAFAVTGGQLDIGSFASFGGSYAQSAGLLQLAGNGARFSGGLTQTGGVLDVDATASSPPARWRKPAACSPSTASMPAPSPAPPASQPAPSARSAAG
jgi:hypothetical protein